jgi:hypothetical protein
VNETRLDDPWCDADHQVRPARSTRTTEWRGEELFIGEALIG